MGSHKERFSTGIHRGRLTTGGLAALLICLTAAGARGAGITEVYGFPGTYSASVIQSADGNFYGTTDTGGAYGYGSIFRLTTSGVQTIIFSFNGTDGATPNPMIQANDGNFYGTTYGGGPYNGGPGYGTIFRVSTNGAISNLFLYGQDGYYGQFNTVGVIQATNGNFYGPIGQLDEIVQITASGTLSNVANIPGGPNTLIQGSDGNLYGTARLGGLHGKVFLAYTGGGDTSLASFNGTNGAYPLAALIQGTDGTLFGTASEGGLYGGTTGFGTVFSGSTNGGVLTALHYFDGTNGANPKAGLALGSDGNFYGTAYGGGSNNYGTVFQMASNGNFTTLAFFNGTNGSNPKSTLVNGLDGNLYGTTSTGGANGNGTFIQVMTNGTVNALWSLAGYSGSTPFAPLILGDDGNFYGTTSAGGANEYGTIFELTASGVATNLCSFGANQDTNGNALDGAFPLGSLTQGTDGNFYGTTSSGGTFGAGTVFQWSASGLTTLVSFNGTNGSDPQGKLIQGSDGSFFGTTLGGGTNGRGTVFNVTTNQTFNTLVSFNGTNGANPYAGLIQGSNGNFYGTCSLGGTNTNDVGIAFMVTSNGTLSALASFNRTNGACPYGSLILGNDGNFYGTTAEGGTNKCGTVFRLTTNGTLTTLAAFGNTNGAIPCAGLVQGTDGDFYGTTRGGLGSSGTVFRLGTNGSLTTLAAFNPSPGGPAQSALFINSTNGGNPQMPLTLGPNGNLFGTSVSGGSGFQGNVFQLIIRPTLQPPVPAAGNLTMSWDVIPGLDYQLQRSSNLTANNWTNVGGPLTATNSVLSQTDTPNPAQSWFYRVALLP